MDRTRRNDTRDNATARRGADGSPGDLPADERAGSRHRGSGDSDGRRGSSGMGAPVGTTLSSASPSQYPPPPAATDTLQMVLQLSSANMALTRDVAELRLQLKDYEQANSTLERERKAEYEEAEDYWQELKSLRERHAATEQELRQARDQLQEARREIAELRNQQRERDWDRRTPARDWPRERSHERLPPRGQGRHQRSRSRDRRAAQRTPPRGPRVAAGHERRSRSRSRPLHPPGGRRNPDRSRSPRTLTGGGRTPSPAPHQVHQRARPLAERLAYPSSAAARTAGETRTEPDQGTPEEIELDAILDRQHKPDHDLEASNQPRSPWYTRWTAQVPLAVAYDELDRTSSDDDDPMGGAHIAPYDPALVPEDESPFPDPILSRAQDMTRKAERSEDNRVRRAQQAGKAKAHDATRAADQEPPMGAEYGPWSGQRILSVVQAHNLRWMAIVERDPAALAFFRALFRVHQNPALRRSAAMRYLITVASDDLRSVKDVRRGEGEVATASDASTIPAIPLPAPPRPEEYPPARAGNAEIVEYYRKTPTSMWPRGLRQANGLVEPVPGPQTFAEPYLPDAYGAFIFKHTLPHYPRRPKVREHTANIKRAMTQLFSVTGAYNWIVERGGYETEHVDYPATYPYDTPGLSAIHMAAWLAEHGIGRESNAIQYLERWCRIARNKSLHRELNDTSPWPDFPRTLEDYQAPDCPLVVVPRRQIHWGQLLDTRGDETADQVEEDSGSGATEGTTMDMIM
ncbi:hypothetical protein FKP32DRAFT_1671316 [Trametes sanguinea]|nr:hypothetical protein FKP32DRAFT_1671316 [Trametes sanguinea]